MKTTRIQSHVVSVVNAIVLLLQMSAIVPIRAKGRRKPA